MKTSLFLVVFAFMTAAHAENYVCETDKESYYLSLGKTSGKVFFEDGDEEKVAVFRSSQGVSVRVRRTVKSDIDWQGKCGVQGKAHINFMLDLKDGKDVGSYYQLLPNYIIKPYSTCSAPMVNPGPAKPMNCKLLKQ